MITDMLTVVTIIDRHESDTVDICAAVDTAVESVDRDVSTEERQELRETLESGWLD